MNNSQLLGNIDSKSDLFGAFASGICLIHCLATPLIFVAQACSSTSSSCDSSPLWWSMIDYIFLVISFVAIHYSTKNTSAKWMPTVLYLSWGLLALVLLNERFSFVPIPHAVIYLPAFSLVVLHLYNRKYCRCEGGMLCSLDV